MDILCFNIILRQCDYYQVDEKWLVKWRRTTMLNDICAGN